MRRSVALPFAAAIGLSAFLLFAVEPLAGRLVLPAFGGAPAAWATSSAWLGPKISARTPLSEKT